MTINTFDVYGDTVLSSFPPLACKFHEGNGHVVLFAALSPSVHGEMKGVIWLSPCA